MNRTSSGTERTAAVTRTQGLRHQDATRTRRTIPARRAASRGRPACLGVLTFVNVSPALDGNDPVPAEIERQLLLEAIDESRAVLIEERDEADGAFLRVPAGEGKRSSVDELPAQRFVAPLGGLNHFAMKRLEIVLHSAEGRPRGALEGRIGGGQ